MFDKVPHADPTTLLEWHLVKDMQVADHPAPLSAVLQVHAVRQAGISTGIEWRILIPDLPGAEDPAHDASLGKAVASAVFKQIGVEAGNIPPYQVLSGERFLYASSDDEQAVRLTGAEATVIFNELVILVLDDDGFTDIQAIDTAIAIARKLFARYWANVPIASVYAQANIDAMVHMRHSLAEDADDDTPAEASSTLPVAEETSVPLHASTDAGLAIALTPGEAKLTLRQLWLAVTLDDELDNAEIDASVQIAHKLFPLCDPTLRLWAKTAIAEMEKAKAWFAVQNEAEAETAGDTEGGRWQVSLRREIGTEVIVRLKAGGEREAIARALESSQWMMFNPATAEYLGGNETAAPMDAQCPRCKQWDAVDYLRAHGQCHACQALSQADSAPESETTRQ